MKQYFRKADLILLIALVVVGLAASAVLAMHESKALGSSGMVVIKSGGEIFATYPLSEDRDVVVPAPSGVDYKNPRSAPADAGDECAGYKYFNVVHVSGGEVSVSSASCKNSVCVRHKAISRSGESIVCLPNKLVVSIEGKDADEGGGYDSISS